MIIRALAWTMLDNGVVLEVSVSKPDALGRDEAPAVWRTFRGSVPEQVWASGSPADLLGWFAGVLLELAGQ
jgi:hypothetical protein